MLMQCLYTVILYYNILNIMSLYPLSLLPFVHVQGVKQLVCSSVVVVVVVVGTKIARSCILGICACYTKHNQSVDSDEKLVCMPFKLLKKAY